MINTTIAHYKVAAKLGQGGMGEVYRATDTKLDREVAIKVMSGEFATNAERVARFEREAKALAKLNHPNIASIFGFDQHEGQWFLVMELIEGETLSERLRTGPMPVDEALQVFKQIAEALEAAHEKQIVHRDLKPGNIKIDPQGRVKVLDFGLAKARFSASADADSKASTADSMAPTISSQFTHPGKVMGTAAYMSPEQSRGQKVDRRTDVWAFGCCLYEALTGKKPFKGATTSDLLADILKSDPNFTVVPPETPSEVLTLLRRCLEKDPQRRLRDLGDIAITLEEVTETSRTQAFRTSQIAAVSEDHNADAKPWWRKALATFKVAGNVALALGFSYAVWTLFLNREKPNGRPDARSSIRTVAVLPFDNITGVAELDFVAEGLADDIGSGLRGIGGLDRVTPWFSARQYKDSTAPASEIAVALQVQRLVFGTVKRQGADLSINVEMFDGADSLWSTNLVINTNEIAGLRSDLVSAIAIELGVDLRQVALRKSSESKGVRMGAYIAFRQGLDYFDGFTTDGFEKAGEKFEEAIRIDPSYGAPYAWRIQNIWVPSSFGGTKISGEEAFGLAFSELDNTRSFLTPTEVFAAEGWIAMVGRWDWTGAVGKFERGIQAEEPTGEAFQAYSTYLRLVEGRYGEALLMSKRALELEPDRINNLNEVAQNYSVRGEYRLAIDQWERIPNRKWAYLSWQAQAYAALGESTEALKRIERAEDLSERHPNVLVKKASILAQMGREVEARSLVAEVRAGMNAGLYFPESWFAEVYFHLGETNQALSSLERGFEQKGSWGGILELRYPEPLAMFGNEPRYWAVVEKMNFPALPVSHPFHDKEQQMRFGRGQASDSKLTDATDPAAAGPNKNRIVVLPFEALGKEDDDLAFAESLTLAVRMQLSKVEDLTVLDGSRLKLGTGSDLAARYKELKAGAVLTGKVQQFGNQLVVNWELQDAQRPEVIASGEGDTTTEEVFVGRGKIAQNVAEALKVELLPAELRELNELPTISEDAYKLYVQGRALWNRRTISDFEKATNYFHQAIALDGEFALAYAGLADCHVLWNIYETTGIDEHSALAIQHSKKALEIDPRLAQPHATLGYALWTFKWDWEGAEKQFQAAMALDSEAPTAFHWYSDMLMCWPGREVESLGIAKRALDLDPTAPVVHTQYAAALYRSSGSDQIRLAIELLEKQVLEDPDFINAQEVLATAYRLGGMMK